MAPLELTDDRGAPVPEEDAVLANDKATFTAHLGLPASYGQTLRFFVDCATALRGQQKTEDAAILRNPNQDDATVNVTYEPATGEAETAQRVLVGGAQTVARVVDGALTLAGPELESLVKARDELLALDAQLPDNDCRDARGYDRGHHASRERCPSHHGSDANASITDALRALDDAIAEANAVDPNERRLAWAIEHALRAVQRLEHHRGIGHISLELRNTIRTTADVVENDLRDAAMASRAITAWVVTNNLAQPGENLDVQVTLLNRGTQHVRNGSVVLSGPEGWGSVGPIAAFNSLKPGESVTVNLQIQVPLNAVIGEAVNLTAELSYDKGCREGLVLTDLEATVDPVIDLAPIAAKIPLGLRGANQATVTLTNLAAHPLDITLAATSPDGVTVDTPEQVVTVNANSSVDLALLVRDTAYITGTGTLNLLAKTASGATVSTSISLSYSDDLALNTVGAPWPFATATSYQAAYPPTLAFDGNASTFWVSGGTVAGQGPTPTQPMILAVDFGVPQSIGSVTMVPRVGYGPKAYTIEVSNDGTTWSVAASVPTAANSTITTTLTPVVARYVRLQITGGWDRIQPPRNVQIISLNVKAPTA
jgi:hypothetical protein